MLLAEINAVRVEFKFHLWAYVIMPNHVHLLLWPLENFYKIESINKAIKGRMAKRFIRACLEKGDDGISFLKEYRIIEKGKENYRIWQAGGGFDRNLWNPEAIHRSMGIDGPGSQIRATRGYCCGHKSHPVGPLVFGRRLRRHSKRNSPYSLTILEMNLIVNSGIISRPFAVTISRS